MDGVRKDGVRKLCSPEAWCGLQGQQVWGGTLGLGSFDVGLKVHWTNGQ